MFYGSSLASQAFCTCLRLQSFCLRACAATIIIALLLWQILFAIAGEASAGPFKSALTAAQRGDFQAADWLLRPLALQGNAVAQFDLGLLYETGRGVPQNYFEAIKWYRLAADQGNALAQFSLGAMYTNGLGVAQDFSTAAKWYLLSAEQGYTWAQFYVGFFAANGQGIPKNVVLAHMWLSLAAASQFEAPFGSLKSLDQKERRAVSDIASGARAKLEKEMTPAQIAEAQKLSADWKPKPVR